MFDQRFIRSCLRAPGARDPRFEPIDQAETVRELARAVAICLCVALFGNLLAIMH